MARTDPRAKVEDCYRLVADSLITQIERGTVPWTQAWKPGKKALMYTVKSGKPYRAGNSVWLVSTADGRGFSDEHWGRTSKSRSRTGRCGAERRTVQSSSGSSKRSGWPGTWRASRCLTTTGNPVYETRALPWAHVYQNTVFNAEQSDGLLARLQRAGASAWDRHESAEHVFKQSRAVLEDSGSYRAYYDLSRDRIVLLCKEQLGPGAAELPPDGSARIRALDRASRPVEPAHPDKRH